MGFLLEMFIIRAATTDSGYRTARIKAIATRSGPAPTVNSESWLLTKEQGCCVPACPSYTGVTILYDSVSPGEPPTYTIYGTASGSNYIFEVAQLEGTC